jgi:glycosyltransferase involved in cell wall biosynthesis
VDGLVRALRARGLDARVLAGLLRGAERKRHRLRRLLRAGARVALPDRRAGYPVHRAIPRRIVAALAERLRLDRPDLVVTGNREAGALARVAADSGVASIVWVHDAAFQWHEGALPEATRVAAVSRFLAERSREVLGRPAEVVRPPVDLEAYRVAERTGGLVVFPNPRVTKGMDLAIEVARRLPDRRFLFVGSRWLPIGEQDRLAAGLRGVGNVVVEPGTNDMREVYARASVVLVPSRCEDAAPRVVLEAQSNAIPVVATRTGGIPEVAGDGAVLLDLSAGADAWAAEVERLLDDPAAAADLGRRAVRNAARPELAPEAAVAAFLRLAQDVVTGVSSAADPVRREGATPA